MSTAPLKYVGATGVTTIIDPRFGTGDNPIQPLTWSSGSSGHPQGVLVETDYTGATDASADINAAIALAYDIGQATASSGGPYSVPVYLKSGILRLDSAIMARRRTVLIGAGTRNTIIKPYGPTTAISAEAVGAAPDDMEFGHFQIDGANQTSAGSAIPKGLYFTQARRVYVHDLWVQNTWATGVGIDRITGVIENCWATNCGRSNASRAAGTYPGNSGIGIGLGNLDGVGMQLTIVGNHCSGNSNYGIFIESQGGVADTRGVVIVGNTCRDNGRSGIGDSGSLGAVIASNICIDNDQAGVALDYGSMGVSLDKGLPGRHVQITGNFVQGNRWGVYCLTAGQLGLEAPKIQGNTIHANTDSGVYLELNGSAEHGNVWIAGNAISENGGHGVEATGTATADRLAITDNRIWDNVGSAVHVGTATTSVRVTDNEAWGNGAGIFFDTAKGHGTPVSIDSAWIDGADTLPA